MQPLGSHHHEPLPMVGPLTEPAFVRRTARDREGVPNRPFPTVSGDREHAGGGVAAAVARYLDALAWPLRQWHVRAAKAPGRDARDRQIG